MERRAARRTRRGFLRGSLALAGLGLLSGCGTLPPAAQQRREIPRVGYLSPDTPTSSEAVPLVEGFLAGLGDLGYVPGQNISVEFRHAEAAPDRLPQIAAELVALRADVIVAVGPLATKAAKEATAAIPIVMAPVADPLGTGLVASLSRPGGTVTGLASIALRLNSKRAELLKEAVPGLSRAAVLWNPDIPGRARDFGETQVAARALGLRLESLEVRAPADFAAAFEAATGERVEALMWFADYLTASEQPRILEFVARARLPSTSDSRRATAAGALMSYGADRADLSRRAAVYVDKILKGARPGDLPVEQPTTFEFVINLRTAQALGLSIPQSVLTQATEIIQ